MTKDQIDQLFTSGKRIYSGSLKAVYLPAESTQIIISAPIKVWKRAVDRNHIKRLIRISLKELPNRNKLKPIGKFNLFIIYNTTTIKSQKEIEKDVDTIIQKLHESK